MQHRNSDSNNIDSKRHVETTMLGLLKAFQLTCLTMENQTCFSLANSLYMLADMANNADSYSAPFNTTQSQQILFQFN